MIGYAVGFVLSLVTAGIVSIPTDKELKYVFDKASNYEELAKVYEDTLNKKSDLAMEKDYVKLLLFIKDKKAEEKTEGYLKKVADLELTTRLIEYLIRLKKPKKAEYWLTKAYALSGDEKYLFKKLELGFAFNKFSLDKKAMLGEIKAALLKNQNTKLIDKSAGYFSSKKDYDGYISTIETAFEATKNPAYSKRLVDAYGFAGNPQKQKKELARYFELTKDFGAVSALYGMGESEYALKALEENIGALGQNELVLLKNIYLWNGEEDKYFALAKGRFSLSALEAGEILHFASIAAAKGDIERAKAAFDALIAKEGGDKALDAGEAMEYVGKPEEALKYYEKHYKTSKNPQTANKLISVAYAMGDSKKGMEYEKQKAFNEQNATAVKSLLFKKAGAGDEEGALRDAKEYAKASQNGEATELYALVLAMSGRELEAKRELKKLPAHSLKKESLYVFATTAIDSEEDTGYLKRYYTESNDTAALKRAGDFGAKKGAAYALLLLESFLGSITLKNIPLALDSLPVSIKEGVSDEIEKKELDPLTLNALGSYWLANENTAKAKSLFLKTLSLDRKNLTALEFCGKIESWNNSPHKALEYFLEYDSLSPLNPEISYYIAELYKILQKPTHSTKYYKIAVERLDRADTTQNVMYVKSVAALRSPDFVKEEFEAIAKNSGDTQLYADYIESLYHAKKYDILGSEFKDFERKRGKNVRLHKLYAYTMIDLGRYKEALSALDGAQKILDSKKERDASILFDRAYLYEKMDEPLNALNAYNRGLRLDPSNKNAIEAKGAIARRLAGYAEAGYSLQGEVPAKTLGLSVPFESVRVGIAAQEYYDKRAALASLEDVERKRFFVGVGNSYLHAKYAFDAEILGKATIEAKTQKSREYKEAIKKSLGYQSYGAYFDKRLSSELSFSGYYHLRDYILDGSLAAKAYLYETSFWYRPKERLALFYKRYAHKIKNRYVEPSIFSFDDYVSDDFGVYSAYDFSHRLSFSFLGGVSIVNDKPQPFATIGVNIADTLSFNIAGVRDSFTGEFQKLFEMALKYRY